MHISTRFEVRWVTGSGFGGHRAMKKTFDRIEDARDFKASKVEKTGDPHTFYRIVKITEEEV